MPDFETVNEIRERQDAEAAKKLKADQKRMGVHPTLSNKPDAVAARAAKQEAPDTSKNTPKKQRSEPGARAYSASADTKSVDSNVNHGPEQQTSPDGNQMNVTGAGTTDASKDKKQS